ncbi:MAG: threonylcarbamoyl-AMP synthase [Anaerolineales bacterium]|nr:threonylcarbamoyl-AMP synthase [Anaerolineales bacterium]
MKTLILPADDPQALTRAVEVLEHGGLVAFPTDTVYGLGALVHNPDSIAKLYAVKERDSAKAIPILVGSIADLDQVSSNINQTARRLAETFWPGPLTLVVLRHPALPDIISPYPTIGVRMPAHSAALNLLGLTGPLAVTSANLSGEPSSRTAKEVLGQLSGRFSLILDSGRSPGGQPSTVVDCTQSKLVLLRPGPLTVAELKVALS